MPVIECDPETARSRLEDAGVVVRAGNTDYEQWRATHAGATVVAYDDKVVVQGGDPGRVVALVEDGGGGSAYVYFDGASRGNPGPAAVGYAIVNSSGIVAEGGERIEATTNNRAEYEALIRALEVAVDYGLSEVELRGDSELVVKQVTGAWNVNDPGLRERRVRVHELLAAFDRWSIEHVPREINERADSLANEALDGN